ncbi:MAG: gliding motility-associated-like protein [Crocinitomix sp.]|jgi:gliding motility-associated-like protein
MIKRTMSFIKRIVKYCKPKLNLHFSRIILTSIILFLFSIKTSAQLPDLGEMANFALFTSNGAVTNAGTSYIEGNVGADIGAISGFGSPTTLVGTTESANALTAQCVLDVQSAYDQLFANPETVLHAASFGAGETVFPGVYVEDGAGSLGGDITLDALGDSNAVFIFKFGGAFNTGAASNVLLSNGTKSCNVFWISGGAIALAASTDMKGTLISSPGAVSMAAGGTLDGRMLSTSGAVFVSVASIIAPCINFHLDTINVACTEDVPDPDILVVLDVYTCDLVPPVIVFVSDVSDGLTCPEVITRTYSSTDNCGNETLVTQLIIVNDITSPTASDLSPISVECIEDVPLPDISLVIDETDNCTAVPVVAFVSDVSDGLTCPVTITRSYSVTDDCGNGILVMQVMTVNDITNPTASNLPPLNVECISDVPLADITLVIDEADNCTVSPVVAFVSDVSDGLTCPETITRSYSVTDDCGNGILVTQMITVNDITNPTASNPAPITVECMIDIPLADITLVIDEADNCTASPVVAFVSDVSDGNICNNEVITRTYSITDNCGNQAFVTQFMTLNAIYPTIDAGIDKTVCESESVSLNAEYSPDATIISWTEPIVDGEAFIPILDTNYYTVSGDYCGCISTDEVSIIVKPSPVASFTFSEFCPDADSPAPIVDADDGTSSFDLQFTPLYGETIDPLTGVISGALEDSIYFVIHTLELDGCVSCDTIDVHVIEVKQEVAYENFCWGESSGDPFVLVDGGSFTFGSPGPGDGALVDLSTGIITAATEGTIYEIVHTLTESGCTQSDSVLIEALGVDEAFTFEDFCPGLPSDTPIPVTPGGTYEILSPIDEATINTTTGSVTNGQEGIIYEIMYSVNVEDSDCNESSIEFVTVIVTDATFEFDNFCAEFGGTPHDMGELGGTFDFGPAPDELAEIDWITGMITGAEGGTIYPVVYTVGECSEQDTILVMALISDDGSFTILDHCSNIETFPIVSGTSAGIFNFNPLPADDAVIDASTGVISNSTGGTYTIQYITPYVPETCQDTVTQTVILFEKPTINTIESAKDVYCPYDDIEAMNITDQTGAVKTYWYKTNPESDLLDSLFTYVPDHLDYGDNLYYVRPISEEGCLGDFEMFNLFLSDTAGMHAINDFEICLGSPAQLEAYGGTKYEWITEVPLSDINNYAPIAFSLKEEIYVVNIQNINNCEVTDSVRVTFKPQNECSLKVFNAFSPNGDGTNDFWIIDNLMNYIPNTVYIYNRWGMEVKKIIDYDNINAVWDGTDKQEEDLPPNTYFYVVITTDFLQNQGGWVQLVR